MPAPFSALTSVNRLVAYFKASEPSSRRDPAFYARGNSITQTLPTPPSSAAALISLATQQSKLLGYHHVNIFRPPTQR